MFAVKNSYLSIILERRDRNDLDVFAVRNNWGYINLSEEELVRLGLKTNIVKTNIETDIVKIQTFLLCKIYIVFFEIDLIESYIGEIYTCNTAFIENTFSYKRERERKINEN